MSIIRGYWNGSFAHAPVTLPGGQGDEARICAPGFAAAYSGPHAHCHENPRATHLSLSVAGLTDCPDLEIELTNDCLRLRRDAFGRATLFWYARNGAIYFATRLTELLRMRAVETTVSAAGLYAYTSFSWIPAPLTPLQDVFAVPAGAELCWRAANTAPVLTTRERFQAGAATEINEEPVAVRQLQDLLAQSTARQLAGIGREPVGVFLSGGLDSAITAAALVRAGARVRAYTLDFGAYGLPEMPQAESVAQYLGIPLIKVEATPRRIRQALRATTHALDLPYGDGVTAPLYLLGEVAAREVSIVFNGEGGDQLFAGWTNKPIIAAGVYETSHPAGDDFDKAYLRTFHRLLGCEEAVFTPAFRRQITGIDPGSWIAAATAGEAGHSLLRRLRRANLMLKGAQNIQPRAAGLALAQCLRQRTLFCDHALAAWTFSVADELYLRGPCEKYLLKRAVESWLPADIVWRGKRGMGAPLTEWTLGPLWRELGRWLKPGALRSGGVFQPDLPLRIATGQFHGQMRGRRIGEILWLLLMWQVWRGGIALSPLPGQSAASLYNPFWLPPRVWQSFSGA
ncbi:MAG: asparagine synthetase B family protein [Blastocatellia bacterium]